ncbi:MAG: 4-alpha-glucanotransferase, partial [Bowdeniella nasicola]|nr:4-alpha-glucanotransferase [Bowdeniella nasicola]
MNDDALRHLATAHGVATEYWDYRGNHQPVRSDTLIAVLAALGVDACDDDAVAAAIEELAIAPWRNMLPPSLVLRAGSDHELAVHVAHGTPVEVELETEDGTRLELSQLDKWVEPREIDGELIGEATFLIPADLPLGWHSIEALTPTGARARMPLAICPNTMPTPRLDTGRGWGAMAQLYSVRSRDSWGIGDARDLAEMGSFFGAVGADFLLINPLHATEIQPPITPSPYLPTSRRFRSPLYIRPEDIPEVAYLTGPQRSLVAWAAEDVRSANLTSDPIDRDASWRAKNQALAVIYAHGLSDARRRDFERFRAEQGAGLEDFALWCALAEKYGDNPWPEELATPDSARAALERIELAERISYFCWLQWILDEQLASAHRSARDAGMGLGIMGDLAVGVHPHGADTWTNPTVFARDISVGAP